MVVMVGGMNVAIAGEPNQASTVPTISEAYHAINESYQESLDRMVRAELRPKSAINCVSSETRP